MSSGKFPAIGIDRHRIGRDGDGVTTLVCAYGCPLRCKMCLNPQCFDENTKVLQYTVEALYNKVKVDDLYFKATGGGITFGGGEPLLFAGFISDFRFLCKNDWKINIETSLNVNEENVLLAAAAADFFIVDIKDMNPEIYKAYTGASDEQVINNLKLLKDIVGAENIKVRVPLIMGYNTEEDCERSVSALRELGFVNIERFSYVDRRV